MAMNELETKPTQTQTQQVDWKKIKETIDNKAHWLGEGESIEVTYGEFEQVKTPRKDDQTGEEYTTDDFKIGGMQKGKHVFVLINQYLFSDLIGQFVAQGQDKKGGKVVFTRPFYYGARRRR